jgi:aminomethyltransferase
VDDLFVYKLPENTASDNSPYFFLAVNASNHQKDLDWMRAHINGFKVDIQDVSDPTYMLALQGPKALGILDRLTHIDPVSVPRFGAARDTLLGRVPVLLGRTGYTGEDGFELFLPAEHALDLWQALIEAGESDGLQPVGLAARDSLRFEAGMPLYGQELSAGRTPLQSRVSFAVDLDKDFIGREALLKEKMEGPQQVLAGFEMLDRGVPRHGYRVKHEGQEVGEVTSGMFSPSTGRYLGNAWLPRELSATGTQIEVEIHAKTRQAQIVKRPFVIPSYRQSAGPS